MTTARRLADFEALSFDCYGTLIDWEPGILRLLQPWARRAGLAVTADQLLEAFAGQEARAEQRHPTQPYPRILHRTMMGIGEQFGRPVSEQDAQRLATSVPDWPAFTDSPDALRSLSRYYRLLILSNVDRASFAQSNRRLAVTFDAIVTAEDVGSYKPAPANFAALVERADRLGVPRDRLLHVAQSLFHDHVPAKAAGLATVWIDRRRNRTGPGATLAPAQPVQPDWTFGSMAEFAQACAADHRAQSNSSSRNPRRL